MEEEYELLINELVDRINHEHFSRATEKRNSYATLIRISYCILARFQAITWLSLV